VEGLRGRRYVLLAVTTDAQAVYAVVCECHWEHRAIWQSEFRELLRTFRPKRAE
jgi:hypothetical protein